MGRNGVNLHNGLTEWSLLVLIYVKLLEVSVLIEDHCCLWNVGAVVQSKVELFDSSRLGVWIGINVSGS